MAGGGLVVRRYVGVLAGEPCRDGVGGVAIEVVPAMIVAPCGARIGDAVGSGQSPHVGLLGHGVREDRVRVWHRHSHG